MWMIMYCIETGSTVEHFEQFNSEVFNSYLHWSVSLYSIEWVCTVQWVYQYIENMADTAIQTHAHMHTHWCVWQQQIQWLQLTCKQESHLHSTQMHCMRTCVSPIFHTLRIDSHTYTLTNSFTWSSSSTNTIHNIGVANKERASDCEQEREKGTAKAESYS